MMRKEDYPPDWTKISRQIRQEAGWKCERCSAPHLAIIERGRGSAWIPVREIRTAGRDEWEDTRTMTWRRLRFYGLTKVILTVAHLDRDTHNNTRSNLSALCQRCHLNHDRHAQHIPGKKYGRDHSRAQQGKLFITSPSAIQ